VLEQNLEEEEHADKTLTQLAEGEIKRLAA
jgi:hypothetical protein